jgi:hypothetical protein
MQFRSVVVLLIFFNTLATTSPAQTDRRLEVGTQFSVLQIDPIGEGAGSIGARASYDLPFRKIIISPELEFNYFPQNPSGNFGETQVLAGGRAGVKVDQFGFFLKARPGLVHFGGGDFKERNNGSSTKFALDVGGVFEYYISQRVALRLDWGDTIIHFSQPVHTGAIPPVKLAGWYHNLQGGGGISLRF